MLIRRVLGEILKSGFGSGRKVLLLACWGLGLVAFGCFLRQFFGIPYIRYMYTASFTFVTLGLSFLLTDAVFVVTDVWRFRRGTGLLLLFGQNSLSAWMISHFFGDELYGFSCRMTAGLPRLLGTDSFQKLFVAIVWAVAVIASVLIWKCVRKAWRGT